MIDMERDLTITAGGVSPVAGDCDQVWSPAPGPSYSHLAYATRHQT